jgi:hypothetical protein
MLAVLMEPGSRPSATPGSWRTASARSPKARTAAGLWAQGRPGRRHYGVRGRPSSSARPSAPTTRVCVEAHRHHDDGDGPGGRPHGR